jgi:restriction system protein
VPQHVIATRSDFGAIRVLDQAKLYKPGHLVDAEEVRAMWGVLDRDRRASKAVVTTTSQFAKGVYKEFADSIPTRLELRDGEQVKQWLAQAYSRRR